MPEKITRNTRIHFGKHKGTPLCDIPTGYLEWYRDNGEFDDWVTASFEELKRRKRGPAEPEDEPVEEDEPEEQKPEANGKRYIDSIIIGFEYALLALADLGHTPPSEAPAYVQGAWVQSLVEASQKIAVTAAIQAEKQGVDLEAELRPLVSEKWAKRNPRPKVKGKEPEIPF